MKIKKKEKSTFKRNLKIYVINNTSYIKFYIFNVCIKYIISI